ncbi:hypothetical protein M2D07_015270 [Pseudomonas sp. BGr12]|uniref:hypothetical protein n=1 Tax=Pseudomonas sp. BGr12 TaxID=2936269 RepID=UPI0025599DB8|nr:hypothetical protein [Pseudomonas sp. BJa5]MDL2428377.1 hypothetical protein [Pseudomonas sp. BJa5]
MTLDENSSALQMKAMNSQTQEGIKSFPLDLDPHVAHVEYKVNCKSTIKKSIEVPRALHGCILLICFIRYLQEKTLEKSHGLRRFVTTVKDFFDFLSFNYKTAASIPKSIIKIYARFLNDDKKLVPSSVRSRNSDFNAMLKWTIEQSWFKALTEKDRVFILSVYADRPSIPTNKHLDGTSPAMSELLTSKEYDDRALLDSLTRFCFGFLYIFKRHRDDIISNRRVKGIIESAMLAHSPDIDWRVNKPDRADYNEIFNAIISSRDTTLLERILFSNQILRNELMAQGKPDTLEDLYRKLKLCVADGGSLRVSVGSSESPYVTFEQLDIRSLLSPCETEEICLRWLLAVDRIQNSGQTELLLSDIEITPSHLTIGYLKGRSSEVRRESTSHKKKTHNYKLIEYAFDLRHRFAKAFPNSSASQHKLFQFESVFKRPQNHFSIAFRPIIFACTPGTNMYEEIAEHFPESKIFQEYFCLLVDQNTSIIRSDPESLEKDDDFPGTKDSKLRTLTVNVVAQSRAIIDGEKRRSPSAFDRRVSNEIDANASAHSVKTKAEVYKNRSQTIHRLDHRASFVRTVGKLQEEDARKLSGLLDQTSIVNLSTVNELLGWDVSNFQGRDIEEFNALVSSAENAGYNCTPFGWLSKPASSERIIIAAPVTAALILSYIKGCQIELKRSTSAARSRSLILQLCYSKMIINSFDQRTISEGKLLLREYDFPPAVI